MIKVTEQLIKQVHESIHPELMEDWGALEATKEDLFDEADRYGVSCWKDDPEDQEWQCAEIERGFNREE